MNQVGKRLLFVLFLCIVVSAHICIIYPDQRGGVDVSTPGSSACYIDDAPCGTRPVGNPTLDLQGGNIFNVLLQQNLNHYNPGFAGFIDVALGLGTNQTSDNQFQVLATIPDYWAHFQATQTNFTIPIMVPNIDCSACTLRVRYNPNKPTEPIFHNCATVRITRTAQVNSKSWGRIYGSIQAGIFASLNNQNNQMAEISPNGQVTPLSARIAVRSVTQQKRMEHIELIQASGIVTSDEVSQVVWFVGNSPSTLHHDVPATMLYSFNTVNGHFSEGVKIASTPVQGDKKQWDAIVATGDSDYPLALIGRSSLGGNQYFFTAYYLTTDGHLSAPIGSTSASGTVPYINTFFTDYNPKTKKIYFLAGHEDTLFHLLARIYVFDGQSSTVSQFQVPSTNYTIQNFHVDVESGDLFTLSPGIWEAGKRTYEWTLIRINSSTGAITPVAVVFKQGQFNFFQGGGVYGSSLTPKREILQVLQRANDNSFVLVAVNIDTGKATIQAGLQLGVNKQYGLSSPVYVAPAL